MRTSHEEFSAFADAGYHMRCQLAAMRAKALSWRRTGLAADLATARAHRDRATYWRSLRRLLRETEAHCCGR